LLKEAKIEKPFNVRILSLWAFIAIFNAILIFVLKKEKHCSEIIAMIQLEI
jgi:hypothetical protein